MQLDVLQTYLLDKPHTIQTLLLGKDVPVCKVNHKMFALVSWRNNLKMINLRCDPDEAVAVRVIFPAISQGYQMDKQHPLSV